MVEINNVQPKTYMNNILSNYVSLELVLGTGGVRVGVGVCVVFLHVLRLGIDR